MIPISKTSHQTSEEMLRRAMGVAEHYGFVPIDSVMPNHYKKNGRESAGRLPGQAEYGSPFDQEFAILMNSYIEHGHASRTEPLLVYHYTSGKDKGSSGLFGLNIVGSSHSIAEALIVKTALAVLEDIGIVDQCVHVNSIGDRDSASRFSKELTAYLRKHINDLPAPTRQAMKKDVFHAFDELLKKQHVLCAAAPSTVEFLTEASRRHLREILEYFEMGEMLYELNPSLIGHRDCYSKTLFEIRAIAPSKDDEIVVYGRGGRYDELSRKLFKVQIPATGIILEYERKGRMPKSIKPHTKARKPKVCFIQLGYEARLRSLSVIETLRKARIPVHQSLGMEQFSAQLACAHELSIPYSIIMGHKEALEGSVIVRNMSTRAQDTILVPRLPEYLKAVL